MANEFRQYDQAKDRVTSFYRDQHEKQTYEFALTMQKRYAEPVGKPLGVWESLTQLDQLVDLSDPDLESSQLQHALQAAEAARRLFPDEKDDWIVLVALIHDLGKMLALRDHLPQWAVVGDTFPLGCEFESTNIHHAFFAHNPDTKNPVYSTKYGVYQEGIGFANVLFSWGHDEYLYQVLKRSGTSLPEVALHVIRFHSFYPWHTQGGYGHLASSQDREFLPWLKSFQKCDLYSKSSQPLDPAALRPFYQKLILKYFPSDQLLW